MSEGIQPLIVGKRKIGPGEPVFIIAEASINHNGSVKRAKQLIEAAHAAGADAVKFQKRNLAEVYQRKILANPNSAEQKYQYLIPLLKEFELPDKAFQAMKQYADTLGIMFLVNGWDKQSIDWIDEHLHMPIYKVGSPDMTNDELLEYIAAKGKPLILSTGMSEEAEVEHAVALLRELKASFALLHTNNTYPAPFDEINMRFMVTLRRFDVPVGYSGHERGVAVSIGAVASGATIIERHLTVDKKLVGPDHKASLLPEEFKEMVEGIRQVEVAVGDGVKRISRAEVMNREILGKSIVAKQFIADGSKIEREMLTTRSPAKGLSPQRMDEIVGVISRRDIAAGEALVEDDLTADTITETFDSSDISWRWGPVGRFHEFEHFLKYNPAVVEFHLSDKDLDDPLPQGHYSQAVVVHAPEYMHRTYLNPAADDAAERKVALKTLQRSVDVARRLGELFTGVPKFVVHPGGVTLQPDADAQKLLANFADTLGQLKSDGVEVLPENLPPRPWVFGGEWFGNIFLLGEEIKRFLDDTGYKTCFDTSHAALACNARQSDVRLAGENLVAMINLLKPYIRHLHVSDAAGIGDEGLQIGEGAINWTAVFKALDGYDGTMVPEIWQGHLHGGKGFLQAMEHLKPYLS